MTSVGEEGDGVDHVGCEVCKSILRGVEGSSGKKEVDETRREGSAFALSASSPLIAPELSILLVTSLWF